MAVPLARARTELRGLLTACRAVEERRTPPFDLDLEDARGKVAAFFPELRELDDLRLDATVLNALARIVQIQESRLRYEAGLFLADPRFLTEKLARVPSESLADAFLASWHPVVQLEQVTGRGLEGAKRYFDALLSWRDRRIEGPEGPAREPQEMSEADLAALGILRREGFLAYLGKMWDELKAAGVSEYWTFVGSDDPARRAYGAAFLVSYGYAELTDEGGRLELRANADRVARKGCRSALVVLGGTA